MPRYNIEYDNTTTIRRNIPEEIGTVLSAKIAVYDRAGSALLASTAATITNIGASPTYTPKCVLTSATKAGENSATFNATPDAISPGDVYRVGGTSSSTDTLTVDSYDSTTRVVTFTDYFRHAHAAGEYAYPRFVTYALATTTETTWTAGLEFTIEWTFYADGAATTSPYMPYTDLGIVLKRIGGEGGMESAFRMRYRPYAEMVGDADYTTLASDAEHELEDLFSSRGLDVRKVVDSHAFYELRLCQMAYSLSAGMGESFEANRTALTARRLELINMIAALPVWQDTNQDLEESDEEKQTFERPYPRRRL